jgi:hypothetical protein
MSRMSYAMREMAVTLVRVVMPTSNTVGDDDLNQTLSTGRESRRSHDRERAYSFHGCLWSSLKSYDSMSEHAL